MKLTGKRVLITGVGVKPVGHVYRDILTGSPSHTSLSHNGEEYKVNIGAACALACAGIGASVCLVSRTLGKLDIVAEWVKEHVPDADITCIAANLADESERQRLMSMLPSDKPLYWVQSVGLGAGTVQLKDDNPYVVLEDINEELMQAETTVLMDTVRLFQSLLPRFRAQPETRVCIVSSMSAVRSFWSGSIHNAVKGAISRFANAQMLEQAPHHIYITDVRPGAVDTGLYDNPAVRNRVVEISATMGYDWSDANGGLRLMPPIAVGEMIATILGSEAHPTSVNLVARGQFPQEGS